LEKDPKIKPVIGWKEWIALPALGVPAIKAKIDTGARTSALHTSFLEEFEAGGLRMVRFGLHPLQRRKDIEIVAEAPLLERRKVKNSGGGAENRYVIQTRVVLGSAAWSIDLTLTNRDQMLFRMLLGRKAVENRFLIDAGKAYLAGRALSKTYQHSKKGKT
jgi:hypothetical protein